MVGYGGGEEGNGRQLTASDYSQAGLISGIATRCIIQPLDVLKIRFQVSFYSYLQHLILCSQTFPSMQ